MSRITKLLSVLLALTMLATACGDDDGTGASVVSRGLGDGYKTQPKVSVVEGNVPKVSVPSVSDPKFKSLLYTYDAANEG